MDRLLRFLASSTARGKILLRTAIISAALVLVAIFLDFAVNVLLLHAVDNYTPWSTLAIVLLVAPPSVFVLLFQTERVHAAQMQLASEQAARAAAEAINLARSRFLANTSHELRTPLSGVIGYSELMLDAAVDQGRVQDAADLERVIVSANRLLGLVNDLLDLAKLDADGIEMQPAPFSVAEMLSEAVEIVRPAAAQNRNAITLTLAEGLQTANSDRDRLKQCTLNVLSNAAKFTSDGAIAVRAWGETRNDRDWLLIEVKDTGAGIRPEHQPFLFEPFMQARSETEHAGDSTGLGLAITRKLTRLMGGDVEFRSNPPRGSTFTLVVPMHLAPDAAATARAAA